MTFDDIAFYQSGVTRIELLRYPIFDFDVYELLAVEALLFNLETIRLQVPDPL
jgi:hypothetical protein